MGLLIFVTVGCLDAGLPGASRTERFNEMIEIFALTAEQKGVAPVDVDATRATLLAINLPREGKSKDDALLALSTGVLFLEGKKISTPIVADVHAYATVRLARLMVKQEEKDGESTSRPSETSLTFLGRGLSDLLPLKDYSGPDFLSSMRVIFAAISKTIGTSEEKTFLSSVMELFLKELLLHEPDQAKLFDHQPYRDILALAILGDEELSAVLARVMLGMEPKEVLDVLLEELVPVDAILNGTPDQREALLNQTQKNIEEVAQSDKVVYTDTPTVDNTLNPGTQPSDFALDPPTEVYLDPLIMTLESKPSCKVPDAEYALEYRWYLSRALIAEETRRDLQTPIIKGMVVKCSVRYFDGLNRSEWVSSASVEVLNSPPVTGTVTLTPTSPKVGDTLRCLRAGFYDKDGDEISYSVQWTVNGQILPNEIINTLKNTSSQSLLFREGDIVGCNIEATDETDVSGVVPSNTVTIGNSAPVILSASTSRPQAKADEPIGCTPGGVSDPDPADTTTLIYRWSNNNVTIPGLASSTDSISGLYARGDAIRCHVSVTDGQSTSSEVTSGVTSVINTTPSLADEVTLDPTTPTILENLECMHPAGSDLDGETLTYTYAWRVNDVVKTGKVSKTLDSNSFKAGDTVSCQVTVSDGTASLVRQSPSPVARGFDALARYGGEPMDLEGSANRLFVAKGKAGVEVYSRDATTGLITYESSYHLGQNASHVTLSPDQDLLFVLSTNFSVAGQDFLSILSWDNQGVLTLVGRFDGLEDPQDLAFLDDQVLIADGQGDLKVVDISSPSNPTLVQTIALPGATTPVLDVVVYGNRLLAAGGSFGVFEIALPLVSNSQAIFSTSRINTSDSARELLISGTTLYVADSAHGVESYDLSSINSPSSTPFTPTGDLPVSGNSQDLALLPGSNLLLIAAGSGNMRNLSISPSLQNSGVPTIGAGGISRGVWTDGDYIYIADGPGGVIVASFNGTVFNSVQRLDAIGEAMALDLKDDRLFVADSGGGFVLLDVSQPTSPQFISSLALESNVGRDILAVDDTLYVAHSAGVAVVNMTTETNPIFIRTLTPIDVSTGATALAESGGVLFVGEGRTGFRVFDIASNPTNPALLGSFNPTGTGGAGSIKNLKVAGQFLFVLDEANGLYIYNVATPSTFSSITLRGQYDTNLHATDITVDLANQVAYLVDQTNGGFKSSVLRLSLVNTLNMTRTDQPDPLLALTTSPNLLNVFEVDDKAYNLLQDGDYLFVAGGQRGLHLINNTSPGTPLVLDDKRIDTDGQSYEVIHDPLSNMFFLADGDNGIVILGNVSE